MKHAVAVAISLFVAVQAVALSPQYEQWGAGPARLLMTRDEAIRWSAIDEDAEARAFVALFWARRDPTPGTPKNEFREEYDKRVVTADRNFPAEKVRGAMSDRGQAFVLFGMPTRIERTGSQRTAAMPAGIADPAAATESTRPYVPSSQDVAGRLPADQTEGQVWTYEGEPAQKMFGQRKAQLRFVDRHGKSQFTMERGTLDYAAAQQRVIAASITQPDLTAAPELPSDVPQSAAAAPPALQTALATPSLAEAVQTFSKETSSAPSPRIHVAVGEFMTGDGLTFHPVQLYVPAAAQIPAAGELTFFGVVRNASGEDVLAFEQPARLLPTQKDFFVDHSLIGLPPGRHRGIFGLAQGGTPLALTTTEFEVTPAVEKAAPAASALILSSHVYPLVEAQKPEEPFAFGGLKVVPKADRTFRPADELWYFVEVRNPGLTAEGGVPKIDLQIEVEGTRTADAKKVRIAAPRRDANATPVKGVPGHYGIGNAIPLTSFKPGEYKFTVKLFDTVRNESWTRSETFRVAE